jgi:hypothetical protein
MHAGESSNTIAPLALFMLRRVRTVPLSGRSSDSTVDGKILFFRVIGPIVVVVITAGGYGRRRRYAGFHDGVFIT